jgi:hypothetical protein
MFIATFRLDSASFSSSRYPDHPGGTPAGVRGRAAVRRHTEGMTSTDAARWPPREAGSPVEASWPALGASAGTHFGASAVVKAGTSLPLTLHWAAFVRGGQGGSGSIPADGDRSVASVALVAAQRARKPIPFLQLTL